MKALYIGRFQPFHNGHLMLIQQVTREYDEVIVGIGSSQYSNTPENPFSADERKKMIKKSLDYNNISNYSIVMIPDIHDPPNWVSHVLSIVSDFDVVFSNNLFTSKLFSEKGYIAEKTPEYDREKYSGKEIRRRMANNEPWEDLVPEPVYEIIIEIEGIQRIKQLMK